jgi:anaerobic selenocysteine-containing dehydrogenase
VPLATGKEGSGGRRTPVTGARVIGGLTPCNVIPEEILTDHPKRYRAMLVESGNPAHSLADSTRMREALAALDLVVVIDVAFTETARLADYVLPVASQFEKAEATFFNFEFPHNYFHVRKALMPPLPGSSPRPSCTRGSSRRSARCRATRWRSCARRGARVARRSATSSSRSRPRTRS